MDLAERYFAAIDKTCLQLVKHPQSGTLYNSEIAPSKGLRRFPVSGFEKYLIFYLPQGNGIDVIRVLHGARDIDSLFAEEEATAEEDDSATGHKRRTPLTGGYNL